MDQFDGCMYHAVFGDALALFHHLPDHPQRNRQYEMDLAVCCHPHDNRPFGLFPGGHGGTADNGRVIVLLPTCRIFPLPTVYTYAIIELEQMFCASLLETVESPSTVSFFTKGCISQPHIHGRETPAL